MAQKAKQLVKDKGILSSPDPRPSHTIPQETSDLVIGFYKSDGCSRLMPGKRLLVSKTWTWHGRTQVQKQLILCHLRELYQLFKEKHPHEQVGLSKFVELRPKHCVLAGASGTHLVCVCTIHQNVKLMLRGARLHDLTSSDDNPLLSYHHCLARLPLCLIAILASANFALEQTC